MPEKLGFNRSNPLYVEDLNNIVSQIDKNSFKSKTFLITGANGMIGTTLIDALMFLNEKYDLQINVICMVRKRVKAEARFGIYLESPYLTIIEHDIIKPINNIKADFIIHAASPSHPLAFHNDFSGTMLVNFIGTYNVLEIARANNSKVVYISSGEIYGENRGDATKLTEDYTGYLPLNNVRQCYPEAKRASEVLMQTYNVQYGLNGIIVRLPRTFGPTMTNEDSKATAQFIRKALAKEDIVLKSSGTQEFSFLYMADAVSAILFLIQNGESSAAYNVSSESCDIKLREFAEVCAKCGQSEIIFENPTEGEKLGSTLVSNAVLSNKKIRDLGWNPKYDISNGISRTLDILNQGL